MSQPNKPKLAPKPAARWPSHGEPIPLPVALSLLYGGGGGSLGSDGSDKESEVDSPPPAKRIKSSLNPMEKENRRKIRNRVASQTSRDRKKKHMEDLERRIAALEEMNKHLMEQNELLRKRSNILEEENSSLTNPHPVTIPASSKPVVTSVDEERVSLTECVPGIDEHRYPYNQPLPVTASVHPPAPPPSSLPSSLETSAAVASEEKGVAAGLTKSAAETLGPAPLPSPLHADSLNEGQPLGQDDHADDIGQLLAILSGPETTSRQEESVPDTENLDNIFADLFQPEGFCPGEPSAPAESTHVVGGPRPQMVPTGELNHCYNQPLDSFISCFDSFVSPGSQVHPMEGFREQDDADFICKLLSVQEQL